MSRTIAIACLIFLCSCAVVTLREVQGLAPIRQSSHVIEARAVYLPTLAEPRWWVKQSQSSDPKNAITIGIERPSFEIVEVKALGPSGSPIKMRRVYRSRDDSNWAERTSYESWAPEEKIEGMKIRELDPGAYRLAIRYVFESTEYRAEWTFTYGSTHEVRRLRFPTWQ
jgi:hypothetical protein